MIHNMRTHLIHRQGKGFKYIRIIILVIKIYGKVPCE